MITDNGTPSSQRRIGTVFLRLRRGGINLRALTRFPVHVVTT
jgi:hypothetical protein